MDLTAPGTVALCERNLGSWIQQPANTWSNLGYVAMGLLLGLRPGDERRSPVRTLIAAIALFVGVASFLFHSTYLFVFQLLDYLGMYLFAGLLITCNLVRMDVIARRRTVPAFLGIAAVSVLPFLVLGGGAGRWTFAVQVLVIAATEARLWTTPSARVSYVPFHTMLALFAIAYTFWLVDATGALCDRDNHLLQGHAAWHLVSALCFPAAARFYQQFRGL